MALHTDENLNHNFKIMGLYIISNRLPLKVSKEKENFIYKRSEGGLATGLGSLDDFEEKHWIGWPGIFLDNETEKKRLLPDCYPRNYIRSSLQRIRFMIIMKVIVIVPYGHSVITFMHTFNMNINTGNRIGK